MSSPGIPTSGNVAKDRFSRVFGSLINGRFTGVLRLADGARQFAIFWEGGAIVDAESSAPEDQVGRVALEAGLVDAATVSESIRRLAQSPGRTQKDILFEMGALRHDAPAKLSRLLLTRRSLRVFALPGASFVVSGEAHRRSEGGPVEPRWTLYRGLRIHYDERRLGEELADLNGYAVKLHPESATILDLFGFSDEERILTAYLGKGYWELHDLADACLTLPRQVVLAGVTALRAVEALDVQSAAKVPRLRKRARETTLPTGRDSVELAPSFGSQPIIPPGAAVGPAPTRTPSTQPPLTRSSAQTPAGLSPRASGTAPPVPQMARGSGPSSPLSRVAGTGPPSGPQPAANVTPASGIIAATRDQIAAKLAQVDSHVDHFAVLEVGKDATSAQIQAAYTALAKTYHPDRLALVKLESMKPQVDRIFTRLNDAYAAISDERRRRQYLDILAQGGEMVVKRRQDEDAARASRIITAEDHYRKGEMNMRRQAWRAALEDFQAAVDLNDTEAEHHALLAWAKWCAASNKDSVFLEVKKGLQKALELNNACLPALLSMGQLYNARGELDRAYVMFQRALAVNESNVEALREVRLIEMRRAKGGDRKGLFDLFRKK